MLCTFINGKDIIRELIVIMHSILLRPLIISELALIAEHHSDLRLDQDISARF